MRKVMAAVAALAATLALASQALGQTQKSAFRPTKTVTIIVPYSPGGGTDVVGRALERHRGDRRDERSRRLDRCPATRRRA